MARSLYVLSSIIPSFSVCYPWGPVGYLGIASRTLRSGPKDHLEIKTNASTRRALRCSVRRLSLPTENLWLPHRLDGFYSLSDLLALRKKLHLCLGGCLARATTLYMMLVWALKISVGTFTFRSYSKGINYKAKITLN